MVKKKEVKQIPCIFYLYLHSKLKEKALKDGTMSIAGLEWHMFQWKIPEVLKPIITKEMEMLGLIKKVDNRTIEFLPSKFSINKLGKICQELKIF